MEKFVEFCQRRVTRSEEKKFKTEKTEEVKRKHFVCVQACLVTEAAVLTGGIRNVAVCDVHLKW